jgi:7,8-dihydropterin-6-yl-methyl-4-(beta-D-ribofuranosyl)aminobenzene 5'-phosphate synthase
MFVRTLFLIGIFLSLNACYSQSGSTIRKPSPIAKVKAANTSDAVVSITTTVNPLGRSTLTPIKSFNAATKTIEKAVETPTKRTELLTITIIYDNNTYDERLESAWGFAALIEYRSHILLFDTGGDGSTLMENMRILGVDPTQIESVVLSHAHGDHTGGLSSLLELGNHPTVYLLPSFSNSFKYQVGRKIEVIEVTPGLSLYEGLYTTGEMGTSIREQALIIQTDLGLVIVTGCAHPGIVEIVEQAKVLYDGGVRLVIGGFHLGSKSESEIHAILTNFRYLEVEQVAPCHCTGDKAIAMFAREYGADFIHTGVGKVIVLNGE